MRVGLLTRNADSWSSLKLRKAIKKRGADPFCFSLSDVVACIGEPIVRVSGVNLLKDVNIILVRPLGRGSLEECIFRIDVLHRLERGGVPVINSPSAIEKAIDKYYSLAILEEKGVPVPRTVATECPEEAAEFLSKFGEVVVKPIFGSRGMGSTKVSDREVALHIFRSLAYHRHVIYIQEFVPHGNRDIRAFVVGDRVVAAMYRVAESWKTNISQGAIPKPLKPEGEVEKLAIKASKALGCEIAGVDLLESARGLIVSEVNSQPSFVGLQTVTKVDIAQAMVDYVLERAR
jgi:ribosomal protein S6--L-glutamate ligase/tetrahydromethanopterin:alpha-L-glutamate ligase